MKNSIKPVIAAALLAVAAAPALAETDAPDGTLLSSEACPANEITSYEDYLERQRGYVRREIENAANENITMAPISDDLLVASVESPDEVAEHIAYEGFECHSITYASDGLVIAGFLWKPVETDGGSYPLIIANRGGNAKFGPMRPWSNWGYHDFLKAGYVVLASQYRGGPGSEGSDEFGGRDLNDVRALLPLGESLGFVDTRNVYLYGGSRGGMMTYMLAREGFPARAIAVRAGAGDLFANREARPAMEEYVFAVRIPNYADDPDAALEKRSAVRWAEEIKTPAILLHGSDDWRVGAQDSLTIAQKLHNAGTPYELHLYAGDTHAMTLNRKNAITSIIKFFDRYKVE